MDQFNPFSNLAGSKYHSNGLLKNSPVSEKYRKLKSSPGDVVRSFVITAAG